ncbi:MAG: hypothetical protein WCR52_00420 [Bacteroidota bacterium]
MKKLFFLSFFLLFILRVNAQILFVNQQVSGGLYDGTSWANAYVTLQQALATALPGDQIWIAKGIYKPGDDNNRERSFALHTGVSIYGGFAGTETQLLQRNPLTNPTVLSGDIGVENLTSDNVYHVVTISGGDSLTVVDGFTIQGGNADGADDGGLLARNHGGGILIVPDGFSLAATPIIRNCRFEQNKASRGGAIAGIPLAQFRCIPEIQHCKFIRNRAEAFGGALYKEGLNLPENPFQIVNCFFQQNYCKQIGGGIAIVNPSDQVRLYGCTFEKDSAKIESGAVYLETREHKTYYDIDSCVFKTNYSYAGSGGLSHLMSGNFLDTVEINIRKTTFLLNSSILGSGGAFASSGFVRYIHIRFVDCYFNSNFAQNGGGGIFVEGYNNSYTETKVDRCFFLGNQTGATSYLGGFYFHGYGSQMVRNLNTITNSVFMYNDGAIASLGNDPGISNTRVVNCSFYRNGSIPFGKYWGTQNNPVDLVQKMQILNSVIWEPQTEGVQKLFFNNNPGDLSVNDYLVEHSMVHLSDCEYAGVNPCGAGMIYGKWPDFLDSLSGQLGLLTYSNFPGYNKGSNIVSDTFGLLKDYQGAARVMCDTVDIGAYEVYKNCTSASFEPYAQGYALIINLLGNPIPCNTPIRAELFSLETGKLHLRLLDDTGTLRRQSTQEVQSAIPALLHIPTNDLAPGIYFLQVVDEAGRVKTEKLVLI